MKPGLIAAYSAFVAAPITYYLIKFHTSGVVDPTGFPVVIVGLIITAIIARVLS